MACTGFQYISTKRVTNRTKPKHDHTCRPMQKGKESVLLLGIPCLSSTNNHVAPPRFGRRCTGFRWRRAEYALSSIPACLHKSTCSLEQNKKRPNQKHTCPWGACGCYRTKITGHTHGLAVSWYCRYRHRYTYICS